MNLLHAIVRHLILILPLLQSLLCRLILAKSGALDSVRLSASEDELLTVLEGALIHCALHQVPPRARTTLQFKIGTAIVR